MSELKYSQLAGNITERLDNTAEYEDWLIIQDYVDGLQEENKRLKSKLECYENGVYFASQVDKLEKQLEQRDEVIDEAINKIEDLRMEKWSIQGTDIMNVLDILTKYKGGNNG